MIPVLALVLSGLPQGPTPLEQLRTFHQDVAVEQHVEAVEKALARTPDGDIRPVGTPKLVRDLRAAGLDVLDGAAERLAFEDPQTRVSDAFALARTAFGFRRGADDVPRRPGLREFERVCSHAMRDLVQALGSGRDLDRIAPQLHAAVEQVRASIENADDLEGEHADLLRGRLERVAKVEQDVVQRLAERIVLVALALDRDDFRQAMRRQPVKSGRSDGAVTGDVLLDRDTGFGRLVVGGFGRNVYDCALIDVILDVGGDDLYRGPVAGAGERRRLSVVVDLDGNDVYQGESDSLGSGTFGIGVLVDLDGDDLYHSRSRSAGFGLGGVGVLLDRAGEDRYELGDQSGGVGLAGTGLFLDLAGADYQEAGVQSLGCGLPGGFGLLLDGSGDDVRKLGVESKRLAEVRDAAARTVDREAPRLQEVSVGFGAGAGALPFLSGGLGIFVDLKGQDEYQAGGLAFGVGIRGGVGLFRDASGDDVYRAGDVGFGAGYARGVGVMRDEGGNDRYEAGHLALGSASGQAIGMFLDGGGDDLYSAFGPALGGARRAGVGSFWDLGGVDQFTLRRTPFDWQIATKETVKGTAIGVFLSLGGGRDVYRFAGMQDPPNDRTRMVEGGDEDFPERLYYVDR